MTENGKKFLERASQDAGLQAELQKAQGEALHALLKAQGLEDAAAKAANEAAVKVASAHGFTLTAADLTAGKLTGLSEDELKAVAGGQVECHCAVGGYSGGDLRCFCAAVGGGTAENGHTGGCACTLIGMGHLDD